MKKLIVSSLVLIVALMGGGVSFAEVGQVASSPTAEQEADQARQAAILDISANRAGTITDLGFQWSPSATALGYPSNAWAVEFATMLQGATDAQLYDIQNAASYDAVRAILQGRSAPVSLDGVAGIKELGDVTSDLVYTPVTPCRILDTRFGTGTYLHPPAGSSRSYYVYGPSATLAPQGHTAGTGCYSPKGEPAAIAANFAVVPSSTGHIRVWPSYYAMPTASFINYQAGNNLANAGIIAVCYGCVYDINVYNSTTTDYLADVMGYFYPAEVNKVASVGTTAGGSGTVSPSAMTTIVSRTISVPTSGRILLMADATFYASGSATASDYLYCQFTEDGFSIRTWDWEAMDKTAGDSYYDMTQSKSFSKAVLAGTHTYALQCQNYGYTSVLWTSYGTDLTTMFVKSGN